MNKPIKQHLIDPEICIRCYTCEMTCPIEAITHDDNNVVVDASKCNFCMDCIPVCPTGSIDEWRVVMEPYSLDDQFEWDELPEQEEIEIEGGDESRHLGRGARRGHRRPSGRGAQGRGRQGQGAGLRLEALGQPLQSRQPGEGVVQGNYRLTAADSDTTCATSS
jgi:benzoyl-CoA 2,3-dioxygenase component A